MKRFFLSAFAAFAFIAINAQEVTFGPTAGLSNINAKVSAMGMDDDESETGFHVGAFADIGISEKFHVQPEVTFANAGDVNLFSINAIAKFYVVEDLAIQAGPTFAFAGGDDIDAIETLLGDDFTNFNFGAAFGLSYDITEKFFAQARYGFQINDHYTGSADLEIKLNNFLVGVGYRI